MYSALFDVIANRLHSFIGLPNNESNRTAMRSVIADTLMEERLKDNSLTSLSDVELSTDALLGTIVLTAKFQENGQEKSERYHFGL